MSKIKQNHQQCDPCTEPPPGGHQRGCVRVAPRCRVPAGRPAGGGTSPGRAPPGLRRVETWRGAWSWRRAGVSVSVWVPGGACHRVHTADGILTATRSSLGASRQRASLSILGPSLSHWCPAVLLVGPWFVPVCTSPPWQALTVQMSRRWPHGTFSPPGNPQIRSGTACPRFPGHATGCWLLGGRARPPGRPLPCSLCSGGRNEIVLAILDPWKFHVNIKSAALFPQRCQLEFFFLSSYF